MFVKRFVYQMRLRNTASDMITMCVQCKQFIPGNVFIAEAKVNMHQHINTFLTLMQNTHNYVWSSMTGAFIFG